MASTPHTSLQLWAAAKIVGRECATVSKEYFLCKKEKGENPAECLKEAQEAMKCTSNV